MRRPGALLAALLLLLLAIDPARAEPDPIVVAQADDPAVADDDPAGAAGGSGGAPSTGSPGANSGIEEIVVQGGESDAVADLEASDSVTGFDASDLEALGAQSVEDLAAFTPNLEIVSSGATTPTFFIRGVGLNDFNANSSGSVAIFQDDVAKNAPALQLQTLYDVEAVNILRGPQGTGAARSASAGAIKMYSRKPTGGFNGYLRSSLGNFDSRDFEGAIEAPIWEDFVSGRLSFRFTERDGVRRNRCAGGDSPECGVTSEGSRDPNDLNAQDRFVDTSVARINNLGNWSARGVFRFQPTLDMDWLLIAQGSRRDELSQLGESYGTNQNHFKEGCGDQTVPGRDRLPECRVLQTLGSGDRLAYRTIENQRRLVELNPCSALVNGKYTPISTPPGCETALARFEFDNKARLQLQDELVDLDAQPWKGSYNRTGPTTNDVWSVALKGDVALGPSLFLTTVSGYDSYDRLTDVDLDFSPNQLFEIVTDDDGWQFYQDLQLGGSLPDAPLNYRVGWYFLRERLNVDVENFFNPATNSLGRAVSDRSYTQDLWSTAGWFSFDWTFWDNFTLDGGVRYNWERKEIDFLLTKGERLIPIAEQRNWGDPTGTIRLTYRFREDTHAYWKYSRGWKAGHFNATTDTGVDCPPEAEVPTDCSDRGVTVAEPESIDAFEAGIRGSWFQGRLGLDTSVFYYNYNNYQIFTAQENAIGDPNFVVINANNAEVYGAEADLVLRPFAGTFLQVRFSWLQSRFLDFVQTQQVQRTTGFQTQLVDLEVQNTGNPLLNSPQFKVSLTAEQTIPLGRFGTLTPRYDGAWTDDTFYDASAGRGLADDFGNIFLPENTIAQRAFWLHNVRLGYRIPDGSIELAGWVRNVADKAYKTFAFDGSSFNRTSIYFVGEPRTYGLTLTTSF